MSRENGIIAIAGQENSCRLQFASDVAGGLSATPESLPCKYLYDEAGSRLFKQIMELDEYYLTRCELEIMDRHDPRYCNVRLSRFVGRQPGGSGGLT